MNRIRYYDKLQKYFINFEDYVDYYDFFDARKVIKEFLAVFEQNFIPKPNLEKSLIKCSFSIINRQPPPQEGITEITDSRVWVTNACEGVYFNDFIKFGITADINKRIIFNGLTGSSSRFKRFDHLSISVNSDEDKKISK